MTGLNANKVKAKSNKQVVQQEPLDPGTYPARLVQVLDLGIQAQKPYQGQEKPPVHKIMMTYELLDEFCVDEKGEVIEDKPRWVSEEIAFRSLKADLAVSTKRYRALDPEEEADGDFQLLLGRPCNVTIVNNESKGKIYNNVGNVSGMRPKDAAKAPELVNPPKFFALAEPDMEVFLSLPEWLQDKIKGNLEFNGSALQEALEGPQEKPVKKPKPTPQAEEEDAPEELVEAPEDEDVQDDDIPW